MFLMNYRPLTLGLTALFGFAIAGAVAPAHSEPATGATAKREWPSQLLPEQPVQVRICSCRYAGENIPIGKTICMKFDGKRVLATCDSIVNSPSWSISKNPCPET